MDELTLDKDMGNLLISPICAYCKHYSPKLGKLRRCTAFENIPLVIWSGENNHKKPYPGDRGIRFEPAERPTA